MGLAKQIAVDSRDLVGTKKHFKPLLLEAFATKGLIALNLSFTPPVYSIIRTLVQVLRQAWTVSSFYWNSSIRQWGHSYSHGMDTECEYTDTGMFRPYHYQNQIIIHIHNHQPLWICSLRIDVEDLGTDKYYSVVEEIGRRVSSAAASPTATQTLGLVSCGTGTGAGVSIFANKFPGVFAATCLSPGDALNARSINNSNCYSLPSESPPTNTITPPATLLGYYYVSYRLSQEQVAT
ncbi:hypothetical protein RJ639_019205 [Escallonia herrerae]|uniref:Uncharacterized protein n=1 Tax=Escallonia herrerae TaxID=1293975 RepID=A0AA88V863_9ASTE|nr:hypothetical protein RJ639_019205 [Escallonia herrerae]